MSLALRKPRSHFQHWPERLALSHRPACCEMLRVITGGHGITLLCGSAGVGKSLSLETVCIELVALGYAVLSLDARLLPPDRLEEAIRDRRAACGAASRLVVAIDHIEAFRREGLKTLERSVEAATGQDPRLAFLFAGFAECWTWIGILDLPVLSGAVVIGLAPLPAAEARRYLARRVRQADLTLKVSRRTLERRLRDTGYLPRGIDAAIPDVTRRRRPEEQLLAPLTDLWAGVVESLSRPVLIRFFTVFLGLAGIAAGGWVWTTARYPSPSPPLEALSVAEPMITLPVPLEITGSAAAGR